MNSKRKPNYSNGKQYKLTAEDINGCIVGTYIGSTVQPLNVRMTKHISKYKKWKVTGKAYCKSFDLFEKYGIDNCKISLIEDYPCSCKAELEKREGEIQKQFIGNGLVNKNIAGRTIKEYRKDNKDKLREYAREYYEDNKDKIVDFQKKYREKNKTKLTELFKSRVKCECGCETSYRNFASHKKSKKHIKLLTPAPAPASAPALAEITTLRVG
jgi:hypothetical protein